MYSITYTYIYAHMHIYTQKLMLLLRKLKAYSSDNGENFFCCEGEKAWKQVAQRCWGISVLGYIWKLFAHGTEKHVLGDPAWAGVLGKMVPKDPSFCDSAKVLKKLQWNWKKKEKKKGIILNPNDLLNPSDLGENKCSLKWMNAFVS